MATKGKVTGVIANMVLLAVDGPVAQNEICYIKTGGDSLMAEVIKVNGAKVYVQVFESTRRLKIGEEAEFTGHMLEVSLAPGMLSKNYDGLQNDLDKMEGVFLKRGDYTNPLDEDKIWHFEPLVKVGDVVTAAAWLGAVEENHQKLKIMAPFGIKGEWSVKSIAAAGDYIMLPLKSATNKYSLNLVYKDTKFRLSKMSANAPAWGVAMLIRNQVIGL